MFKVLRRQIVLYQGILASLLFFFTLFAYSQPALKTIAITQLVSHVSLDKVYQGIIDELAKKGYQEGKNAHIVFANAQGSPVLAAQIAQQFASSQPDVMIAIATSSAQAAAKAIKGTTIPLVFASVSDPVQAKLVTRLVAPGGNITGTRNVSPFDMQMDFVKQILPKVKTLGVVINNGEANSVDLLHALVQTAKRFNVVIQTASVSNSAEVQTAVSGLVMQVDAIFLLQDNTVASALPALLAVTNAHHVPVFSTYVDAVKSGALAGLAFDEYAIGQQTADMAVKILQGTKPGELSVEDPTHLMKVINADAAKKLKINLNQINIRDASVI